MAKRNVKEDAQINKTMQYMICICGAEFQEINEDGVYDAETTEKVYFEHWNNDCDKVPAEPEAVSPVVSGVPDTPVISATPTADVPVNMEE